MSLLSAIAGVRAPDVVGNVEQGRTDVINRRLNAQKVETGDIELAKAKSTKVSFKDQLAEMQAKSELTFRIADTLLNQPLEQRAATAQQFNIPGADLSDEALQAVRSEAVYGMDAVGEFGKAEADAARLEAMGKPEEAAAVRQSMKDKYGKEAKIERVQLFDKNTNEPFWVTQLPNGKYERDGKILTEQQLDRYTKKGIDKSETGDPGAFTKGEGEGLRAMEFSTGAALGLINRIREQAKEGGASIMGIVGVGQRFAGAAAAQLEAAAQIAGGTAEVNGKKAEESSLRDAANYTQQIEKSFGKAGQSAAFKANIVDLAYALARAANPDGRISNQDVNHQIDRLAVNGDPKQLLAVLDETESAVIRNYDTMATSLKQPTGKFKKMTPEKKTRRQELMDKHLGKP